ncbi:MAG: DUF1499 domain-containing protein [Alphaproteobacteria bacterium]|nr:DUF1499 domain-containing protein [Alphaproteobacteria bacterium]
MARRFFDPYQQQSASPLSTWARNLALLAVVTVVVAIVVVRLEFLETNPSLVTFFVGLGIASLSVLISLIGLAEIWHNGTRGTARIVLALFINALVLAYPAYLLVQYRKLPQITDITTDPVDPPGFELLARLRTGTGTNPATYPGMATAELQRQFYPDIEPVELEVSADSAFTFALRLVTRHKWLIIDSRPPQPPRRIGRIEAVARTPIMGFREDVAIRVAPDGDNARVDIRSASRNFSTDFGSNATRVTRFIEDLTTAAEGGEAKPARKSGASGAPKPARK